MSNPLLQIDSLTKSFGDLILFRDLSFGIAEGDKIGLIAKNGAGKTTLLNIITGKEPYDSGRVVPRNDLRYAYLDQAPQYDPELTILQACLNTSNEAVKAIEYYEEAIESGDQEKLAHAITQMDLQNAWDYEQRIKQILNQLKIDSYNQKIGHLSGGQIKRIALANTLIAEPELIILDEPSNHLDLEMVEWLEDYLSRSQISLLMVTHDRYFLDRVCNKIIEIDNQQIYTYKGNYAFYLEKREERIAADEAEMERAKNLYRKELDWMRRQPQARATKAKSRIDAFYELEEKTRKRNANKEMNLQVKGSYIGKKIFEASDISKRYDDVVIADNFNYIFTRYEKMGIVGNNGTGKSTFIKMLLGLVEPDSGSFDIGETVNFGYYSQEGLEFNEQTKVIDVVQAIAEVIDLGDGHRLTASQFLQHFLFSPSRQHDPVYKLSGGEKRRLYLCTVLIKNPNFLILDEPTNDLDIVTLNVLEEYLSGFKGCLIVISHDRYFMDKVVDHLLIFNGGGDIQQFPGNYTQYRDFREKEEKEERKQITDQKPDKKENDHPQAKKEEKKKLTYREKQEFESLEREIEVLESEKDTLTTTLSSGNMSTDEILTNSKRIAFLLEEIEMKTLRWLELSEFEE